MSINVSLNYLWFLRYFCERFKTKLNKQLSSRLHEKSPLTWWKMFRSDFSSITIFICHENFSITRCLHPVLTANKTQRQEDWRWSKVTSNYSTFDFLPLSFQLIRNKSINLLMITKNYFCSIPVKINIDVRHSTLNENANLRSAKFTTKCKFFNLSMLEAEASLLLEHKKLTKTIKASAHESKYNEKYWAIELTA